MAKQLSYDKKQHRTSATISERDRQMIEFIWRHRVVTFRTLHTLFYRDQKLRTCYNRLHKLRGHGHILTRGFEDNQDRYWCLGRRGMDYMVHKKGEIFKTKGFSPQSPVHDHMASSILLGDWLFKVPRGVTIITEQELLSLDLSVVAPGLQNDKVRRPDGLWRFEVGQEKKFLALEVELNAKNDSDYVEIIKSYDNLYSINKIIWVVESPTLIRKIFGFAQLHSILKPDAHLFLLADDIRRSLWQAKFKNDHLHQTSLGEYLNSFLTHPKTAPMIHPEMHPMITRGLDMESLTKNVLFSFASCFAKSDTYTKLLRTLKT